jgi:hypothetical protein
MRTTDPAPEYVSTNAPAVTVYIVISNSSGIDASNMAFSLQTNKPLAEQIIMLSGASENIRKDPLWTLEDGDEYLNSKAREVSNAWRDQPSSTYEDALAQTQRIAKR